METDQSVNLTPEEREKMEKLFLEIGQKAQESTFLEMEEADEMLVSNVKKLTEEKIPDFKALLNGKKISEKELSGFIAGLDSEVVFDVIKDIFIQNQFLQG